MHRYSIKDGQNIIEISLVIRPKLSTILKNGDMFLFAL